MRRAFLIKLTALSVLAAMLLSACSGEVSESTSSTVQSDTSQSAESQVQSEETVGIMRDITSQQLVEEMNIGWNLGNTLDVCAADRNGDGRVDEHPEEGEKVDETLWGNPKATKELFAALKEDGINAVRIPVTWRDHLDDDDNIDAEWMDRVQEVVDYAYDQGMYVIINIHHDGGGDPQFGAWVTSYATEDYGKFYARYSKIWSQIADRFKDYSDYLVFESMNEVGFDNLSQSDAYALLNRINQDFVDLIRKSGGNNVQRHLLIAGYWTDIACTCNDLFKMPEDPAGRCIVSVHYYTPWDFCTTDIRHTWGTDSEVAEMENLIGRMNTTFVEKGIPVIIGEYAASGSDLASCIFFIEKLNKLCSDYGMAAFYWDNGGQVNRNTYEWRTMTFLEAMQRGTSGEDYEVTKIEV
ncbi:MAG: glycoside hydrolase family 5 protein [Eubacterium sp.]|nr:glycoside hydrolase family 5 protein [Eubacterium sp.]